MFILLYPYLYLLYRYNLFLFPWGFPFIVFYGLIFCPVLASNDEIKKINLTDKGIRKIRADTVSLNNVKMQEISN